MMRKRCKMTYPKSYRRKGTIYQVSDPALKDWVRSKCSVGAVEKFHFNGTITDLNDAAYAPYKNVSYMPEFDGPPYRLLASLGDRFGKSTLSCTLRMSEMTGQIQAKHPVLPYWTVVNRLMYDTNNYCREAIAEAMTWEWMEGAKK